MYKKIKNLRTIGIKFGTELEIIKRNGDWICQII